MVNGKNKKELFKILVDNEFDRLASRLMTACSGEFLAEAWRTFEKTTSNPFYNEHETFLSRQNATGLEQPWKQTYMVGNRKNENPERDEFLKAYHKRDIGELAKLEEDNPIIARIKELKTKAYQDYKRQ